MAAGIDAARNLISGVQIYRNKEMPEDKRKYMASYRLWNAIISSFVEIGLGLVVISKKVQNFLADRLIGHIKDRASQEICKNGLKNISSIIIAAILAKRLFVPFVVSPIAAWHKRKFLDKKEHDKTCKIYMPKFDMTF